MLYDVHAWVGVCAGLVLYLMFITGIVALVWESVEAWEEPAHHSAPTGDVDAWWRALEREAESADTRLYLMPVS
ncbi:MAG: PepSY domain-containing protein, partial [Nannocystaceae bacterium]|nr:PepSY domain-containing protein [Nannocystaceae bacterium]